MTGAKGRLSLVSGAVLLGGASSRMGSDKARLEIEGTPAATRVARLLDAICEELLLVGGEPPPGTPGRAVPDAEGPPCALRGLVSALESAVGEEVLVLACDLPLVTSELLLALVAWPPAPVVAPRSEGRSHPLCALYRRDAVLPVARRRLAAGQLALHELLAELETAYVDESELAILDPQGRALANVNTPEELERVRGWLREAP